MPRRIALSPLYCCFWCDRGNYFATQGMACRAAGSKTMARTLLQPAKQAVEVQAMRTVSRLTLRIGGVGYALALLLMLGHWSYAAASDPLLDPLRDIAVRTITRFVTKSLPGSLEVGALRGSLFSAPVLQNVTLRHLVCFLLSLKILCLHERGKRNEQSSLSVHNRQDR